MNINKNQFLVAVLHGGFEPESYGSNLTGENIYQALIKSKYKRVQKVFVDKDIIGNLQKIRPDFAFLSMFCKWGEDGVIQSLLEIMDIPYSGSGVEASSLCKNKYFFNRFVAGCGLYAPDSYFCGNEDDLNKNSLHIKFPCIVKPLYQGYSLGTSIVKSMKELKRATRKAFLFSTKITIQEYIKGREFTVGIIDTPGSRQIVLPIVEVKILGHDIQDTEVKDNPKLLEEIIPARLTGKEEATIRKESLELYNKLGCLGVSRFDVRLGINGKFYFLENNACPGILSYEMSDLPKQLKSIGISLEEYVDNMIKVCLNRPQGKLEFIC